MDILSADEILRELLANGILKDEDIATKKLEMNKKLLKNVHHFSINKRDDGRFVTKVILPDGKKKQISAVAEKEFYKKLYAFYFPEDTENTIENLFQKWMIDRRDNTSVKSKTLQEATNEWKCFFKDSDLSKMNIKNVRPVTITKFFRKITKDCQYTQKRISNAKSVLSGIFQYAIEEDLIDHNPVREVNFKNFTYKPVNNENDVFSVNDVVKLLSYLENIHDPYALAIALDFNLLIRIGELKALKWEDVNWTNQTIYIHEQCLIDREMNDDLTFNSRTIYISDRIKGNTRHGYRTIPLTPEAVRLLQIAKDINPIGPYIFMSNNRPLTTDNFNRRLKKYCKQVGIEYHSSHKIRFFAASTAFNGTNLATVSKLMGHSNVQTTMHYLRDVHKGTDARKAVSRLGLQNTLQNEKETYEN